MIIPFGKYKGQELESLPSSYLLWLAENCDWNDKVCEAADEEWQYREHYNLHEQFEDDYYDNSR